MTTNLSPWQGQGVVEYITIFAGSNHSFHLDCKVCNDVFVSEKVEDAKKGVVFPLPRIYVDEVFYVR